MNHVDKTSLRGPKRFCTKHQRLLLIISGAILYVVIQQYRLIFDNSNNNNTLTTTKTTDLGGHRINNSNHQQRLTPATITVTASQSQNKNSNSNTNTDNHKNNKFAYAFLVGSVRATHRPGSDYRGGLYSIVAIVHQLRSLGSVADFIIMVQISSTACGNENDNRGEDEDHDDDDDDDCNTLTKLEQAIFSKLNIEIVYLPKMPDPVMETFYSLVVQGKLYILNLVDYERVMFLDFDIFPKCNLDYLMDLSLKGILKPNVVMGYINEPCNAGLFVLEPERGVYANELQPIIDRKELKGMTLPFPYWDETEGWGHTISREDQWISPEGQTGTKWNWAYSFADQGLLYYWTKYYKRSVSLITYGKVVNWGDATQSTSSCNTTSTPIVTTQTGKVCQENVLHDVLERYSSSCQGRRRQNFTSPYDDIHHFTGRTKPWLVKRGLLEEAIASSEYDELRVREHWYYHLKRALIEIGMEDEILSLGFIGPQNMFKQPVGLASAPRQVERYVAKKYELQYGVSMSDPISKDDFLKRMMTSKHY
jgi:hypothetical protein